MFWCKLAELFFKTRPRKSVRKNILARCVEHLSSGASVHGQLSARCFNRYSTHVFRLRNYAASAALDTLCQRLSPLYKELGWVSLAGLELSHFNPLLTNLSPRRIALWGVLPPLTQSPANTPRLLIFFADAVGHLSLQFTPTANSHPLYST